MTGASAGVSAPGACDQGQSTGMVEMTYVNLTLLAQVKDSKKVSELIALEIVACADCLPNSVQCPSSQTWPKISNKGSGRTNPCGPKIPSLDCHGQQEPQLISLGCSWGWDVA